MAEPSLADFGIATQKDAEPSLSDFGVDADKISLDDFKSPEESIPKTLEFTLFTPWGDYNWDTGLEIEKDTAAALMGFSEGMVALGRGIEQIAVKGAETVGMDVQAQKTMQERQKKLYQVILHFL